MGQFDPLPTFEQFYGCTREEAAADIAERNRQVKIAEAKEAVICAAKAWAERKGYCTIAEGVAYEKACESLMKAVARLEKLEMEGK